MNREQEANLINLVRALYYVAAHSEKKEIIIPVDIMKEIYQFMEAHSNLK